MKNYTDEELKTELDRRKIAKLKALINKLSVPLDETAEIAVDKILEWFGDINERKNNDTKNYQP